MTQIGINNLSQPAFIHAMLGGYPLAFFSAALVTDLVYAATAQMQWANFSVWLIAAGVAMGIVAALVGIVDALRRRRQPERARGRASPLHGILTVATLAIAIVNGFIHSRDAWTSVVPDGLVLSAITTLLVIATAWLGHPVARRDAAGMR